MPQLDFFFYSNVIIYFFALFITLYFFLSFIILPKVLSVLKIRKQKLDYLSKIAFLYKMRLQSLDYKFFEKNLIIVKTLVKLAFINIKNQVKKH